MMRITLTRSRKVKKLSDKRAQVRIGPERRAVKLNVDVPPGGSGIFDFTFDYTFE